MSYKILKPSHLKEIPLFTTEFSSKNIVIDLSSIDVSLKEILAFKEIVIKKNENDTSFVIINSTVNIDDVPEEINIVPTLQEAIDIIEMDEMMRDLE